MEVQAQIPPGMGATHNFIRVHDPEEIHSFKDMFDTIPDTEELGDLAISKPDRNERRRAAADAEQIAADMWKDYQACLRERGMM
jgi:hypothetical protein